MAESLAERRRKDEQVRETISQKLSESGEKDRYVQVWRGRPTCQCGPPPAGVAGRSGGNPPQWFRAATRQMMAQALREEAPARPRNAVATC